MTQQNAKIPDILLEQYILGELAPTKADQIRKQAESDPDLAARIAALRSSDEEILARYPARPMAASIRQKAQAHKAEKRSFNFAALAVPAAAALVLLVTVTLWSGGAFRAPSGGKTIDSVKSDGEIIYTKGIQTQLKIYRKNGSVNEKLAHNAHAAEGDELQLSYIAADAEFGFIFSIDGRGALTRHFPSGNEVLAARLKHDGEQLLQYSYRLDDAPGFERFFFVTSTQPFQIADLTAAAQKLADSTQVAASARLEAAEGLKLHEVLLLKP